MKKVYGKQVVPLLLLHGWPGSIREFYEFIPLLTTPRSEFDFVFEIIAPSLPGFGFSDAAAIPGLGPARIASIFNDLMIRLGHNKYYVQGGDWGSITGSLLALIRPENVIGYHSNFCYVDTPWSKIQRIMAALFPSLFVDDHKQSEYSEYFSFLLEESGYYHIQATKPDTIGVGLTDSPVGLAAYILEKFSTATNRNWRSLPDGGLEYFDKSALLDNIMLYWISNSITSSMRIYSENESSEYKSLNLAKIPVKTPTACARFNHEILYSMTSMLTPHYTDLVQVTDFPKGGHFAAFEVPDILANDVWKFVKTLRSRTVQNKK